MRPPSAQPRAKLRLRPSRLRLARSVGQILPKKTGDTQAIIRGLMDKRFFRRTAGVACFSAFIGVIFLIGPAGQSRTVTDRVYSDAQATRGQQLYKAQCVTCHGETLEGVVGPPLSGNS